MKKIISLVLCLALCMSLCSFIGVSAEETVVFSDSFEDGLINWKLKNNKTTEKNCKLITDKASDGKNSVMVNDDWEEGSFGYQSVNIPAVPGQTYTVSADFYHEEDPSIKVFFTFEDGDKKRLENKSFTTKETKKWSNASLTLEAPAGTVNIVLHLTGSTAPTGKTYFDNIKITTDGKVASVTPAAPVTQKGAVVFSESFENGTDNWKFSSSKHCNDENSKFVTDKASDGKTSAFVIDDSEEGAAGFVLAKRVPAKAGATYTSSADIFNVEGAGAKIFFACFDADGKRLISNSVGTSTVGEWKRVTRTDVAPEGTVEFTVYITGSTKTVGKTYVDNIKVVCEDGGETQEETKLEKINKSSIVLFLSSPNALVNGEKTHIDKTNDKVIADTVDGRTLVPVRFIAENYGAEVGWDDPTQTVTLKMADKTVKIVLNQKEIDVNGSKIAIDVPAQTIEGRTMLPLRAFVESVMSKTIFWDDRGLIVITDEALLDASADKDTIDTIINNVK